MKMPTSPQMICRELPSFEASNFDSVRAAFQNAETCVLRQAWLPKPEADFAPAIVRAGWRDHSLLLFAELTDADIFTRATDHHQRFWELGDTFEIFLRPVEQKSYVEFHVTPNNLRLQLRFADAGALEHSRKIDSFENVTVHDNLFHFKTWIQSNGGRWFAFAEIPAGSVGEKSKSLPGSKWLFSFSRYDYTRGRNEPVISSTSAHTKPDFHCQNEWGTLRFEPAITKP
ncbi:MAG: hypothetical protein ACREFE_14420 [Limisphaerales bacterium]